MRAVIVREPGLSGIALGETPAPEPAPDEVLVAVRTVGVNRLDLNVIAGIGPGAQARLPRVLGIDPAGVVVALGDQTGAITGGDIAVGDRVVAKPNIACGSCERCARGDDGDCPAQRVLGVHRDGGAAELVAVPATNIVPIGELPFAEATAAIHAVPIAMHALAATGIDLAGRRVLVLGAAGAVGSAAVQLALLAGAETIAAVRRPDAEVATGATVVVHRDPGDLEAAVRAVAPAGADIVLDATGDSATIAAGVRLLAWGGRLVFCSAGAAGEITIDLRALYLGRRAVVGTASASRAQAREGIRLVREGLVRIAPAERIPFAEAVPAYRGFAGRARGGKVVIDVSG